MAVRWSSSGWIRHLAPVGLLLALVGSAQSQTTDAPITTAVDEEEGEYLLAGNGYSLYLFKADAQGTGSVGARSACEGNCLATWPPLIVNAAPVGTGKVQVDLLGTITLADGSLQATYNGQPLYFFAEDIKPGDINGHDIESFGEDWYLIGPSGERARDQRDSPGRVSGPTFPLFTRSQRDINARGSVDILQTDTKLQVVPHHPRANSHRGLTIIFVDFEFVPFLWSSLDEMVELYGDPLAIWRNWADDVRGHAIVSHHHVAEEAPSDLAAALNAFF